MRFLAFVVATISLTSACGNEAAPAPKGPDPVPVGATPQDPNLIKIVSSLPRTGSAKAQTDSIVNGIRMALDEAQWKAEKFTIKYEDLDDATATAGQWTPEKEAANADQAVKDLDVMVYIGTYNSGAAKISIPRLNQADLLMISPANTWPGLSKPGKGDRGEPDIYRPNKGKINYVRVVPADDIQGPLGAEWAQKMGVKSVFVLDDREVYGKGVADLFKARAEEIGLKVLGSEGIDAQAQEFKPLMTKIKALKPELIYFGGTTQTKAGQVAKDMRAVGLACKFMVPDGCFEDAFIAAAGAQNLKDCFITFGGLPPEKLKGKGAAFVASYKKVYGKEPEAYAAYGYESANVALEAIRRAGKKDRDAIRQAALGIKNFEGALGKWSFDKNGDTTLRTMSGNTVADGKFKFVDVLGEE